VWRHRGHPRVPAGIQPGDRIIKIEGLSTKDMQLTDAVKRMRGKPARRSPSASCAEGWTEPKDFEITPRADPRPVGRRQQLEPGIEYIRLRQFQEQTASDLEPRSRSIQGRARSRASSWTCATTRAAS
jgi:carboxyl-terminal processing protease